jgi:hypothetical protein
MLRQCKRQTPPRAPTTTRPRIGVINTQIKRAYSQGGPCRRSCRRNNSQRHTCRRNDGTMRRVVLFASIRSNVALGPLSDSRLHSQTHLAGPRRTRKTGCGRRKSTRTDLGSLRGGVLLKVVGCSLGMRGCRENGAVVVLEDFQPGRDIGGTVLPRFQV